MAKNVKKAGATKKKANSYKKAPPIPPGEILGTAGQRWIIGDPIGSGGFGAIYSACDYEENDEENVPSSYPYVVKIEPIENGPLFVETNFYMNIYRNNNIDEFMALRNLTHLGLPTYFGGGEHTYTNKKTQKQTVLRYLVLERYGADIDKKFKEAGRFSAPTVFQIGLQVLDVLEYIHSHKAPYIHADIKGANIMLGLYPDSENQVYLLDYGLAWKLHDKNYMPKPNNAHEGTLEYTSRDRHHGAQTKRGDLEILGYNMLQWLAGALPWETLTEPQEVQEKKTHFMDNLRDTFRTEYPYIPDNLIRFFEHINTLGMGDPPDYKKCRDIFENYLTSVGKTRTSKLEFSSKSLDTQRSLETDVHELADNALTKSTNDNEHIAPEESNDVDTIANLQTNTTMSDCNDKLTLERFDNSRDTEEKNLERISISSSDLSLLDSKSFSGLQKKKASKNNKKNENVMSPSEIQFETVDLLHKNKLVSKAEKATTSTDLKTSAISNEKPSESVKSLTSQFVDFLASSLSANNDRRKLAEDSCKTTETKTRSRDNSTRRIFKARIVDINTNNDSKVIEFSSSSEDEKLTKTNKNKVDYTDEINDKNGDTKKKAKAKKYKFRNSIDKQTTKSTIDSNKRKDNLDMNKADKGNDEENDRETQIDDSIKLKKKRKKLKTTSSIEHSQDDILSNDDQEQRIKRNNISKQDAVNTSEILFSSIDYIEDSIIVQQADQEKTNKNKKKKKNNKNKASEVKLQKEKKVINNYYRDDDYVPYAKKSKSKNNKKLNLSDKCSPLKDKKAKLSKDKVEKSMETNKSKTVVENVCERTKKKKTKVSKDRESNVQEDSKCKKRKLSGTSSEDDFLINIKKKTPEKSYNCKDMEYSDLPCRKSIRLSNSEVY